MTIQEMIQALAGVKTVYAKVGKVTAVDREYRTIDVEPVDGSAPVFDVTLQNSSAAGLTIYPKEGSFVLIVFTGAATAAMASAGEIDSVELAIGDTTMAIDKDGIEINGGDLGGIVKADELKTQLDKATARIDGIMDALKNSATGTQDGGAAYKAAIVAALESITDKEDYGGIKDDKVKH